FCLYALSQYFQAGISSIRCNMAGIPATKESSKVCIRPAIEAGTRPVAGLPSFFVVIRSSYFSSPGFGVSGPQAVNRSLKGEVARWQQKRRCPKTPPNRVLYGFHIAFFAFDLYRL
ncbi:MAG: hypothetical protein M0T70_14575, partial [Geobacteraceae bacterium]|nr:hypothetical protein [Geobacteraceae bacterium]